MFISFASSPKVPSNYQLPSSARKPSQTLSFSGGDLVLIKPKVSSQQAQDWIKDLKFERRSDQTVKVTNLKREHRIIQKTEYRLLEALLNAWPNTETLHGLVPAADVDKYALVSAGNMDNGLPSALRDLDAAFRVKDCGGKYEFRKLVLVNK
jgi:hypothetical protein